MNQAENMKPMDMVNWAHRQNTRNQTQKHLLVYLASRQGSNGYCFAKTKTIMAEMQIKSDDTFYKARTGLIQDGYISFDGEDYIVNTSRNNPIVITPKNRVSTLKNRVKSPETAPQKLGSSTLKNRVPTLKNRVSNPKNSGSHIEEQTINRQLTDIEQTGRADTRSPVQDYPDYYFSDGDYPEEYFCGGDVEPDGEPDCGQFELSAPDQQPEPEPEAKPEPVEAKPKKPAKRKPTLETISVDDVADWIAKQRSLGKLLNVDEHEALEEFKDYWRARGKRYSDNIAAFRNWLRNTEKFDNERKNHDQHARANHGCPDAQPNPESSDRIGAGIGTDRQADPYDIRKNLTEYVRQKRARLSGEDAENRDYGAIIEAQGRCDDGLDGGAARLLSA